MTVYDFDRNHAFAPDTPADVLLRILCDENADIPYQLRADAAKALAAVNETEREVSK